MSALVIGKNLRKRMENFLGDLQLLSKQHRIYVHGCGCCGSPKLIDVGTEEANIIKTNKNLEHIQSINVKDYNDDVSQAKFEKEELDIESDDMYFGDFRSPEITEKMHVMPVLPEKWQGFWKHRNGATYEVIALSNTNSVNQEYPPTVIYRGTKNGKIWSRPILEWNRSFIKVQEVK